ncbi:hypothetical protein PABG_03626 [Paracoccidioides brasiliensis Pb03]|nr:hypothetical protein PABG_03626 [Paracoccidioides brasiliensis Pb03]
MPSAVKAQQPHINPTESAARRTYGRTRRPVGTLRTAAGRRGHPMPFTIDRIALSVQKVRSNQPEAEAADRLASPRPASLRVVTTTCDCGLDLTPIGVSQHVVLHDTD